VTWKQADDDEELVAVLARALETSLDPREEALVNEVGARAVAVLMIEDARSGVRYRALREWWNLVVLDGVTAGVVLPVVFTGCDREGLDEATLYHIAVVAEQRSRGLGKVLLGRATDTLLAHGVWRIYCDTAAENAPMIRLFEGQKWSRLSPIEVGPL
jgi:GNAT superfamily N-acetyltransferase